MLVPVYHVCHWFNFLLVISRSAFTLARSQFESTCFCVWGWSIRLLVQARPLRDTVRCWFPLVPAQTDLLAYRWESIYRKTQVTWQSQVAGLPKVCHSDEGSWEHLFWRNFVGTPVPSKVRGNTCSDEGSWEYLFRLWFLGIPVPSKIYLLSKDLCLLS